MRWTTRDLDAAPPEMVNRLRWLLDAERLSKVAGHLESVLAQRPERGSPDFAKQQFARADAAEGLREIDEWLLVDLSDEELD